MRALDCLVAEHVVIWTFLDTIAEAHDAMQRGVRPPRRFFDLLVEFAREFVDRFHHGKEELQTFELLGRRHHGALDSQIEILREQHDQGREHITAIAGALDRYEAGSDDAVTELMAHMAIFTSLLRLHIQREDAVFFPLAAESFIEEEELELEVLFRQVDEAMGDEFVADSERLVHYMGTLLVGRGERAGA